MRKCCGECKYNFYDRELKGFYCNNEDGEYVGCPIAYDDTCKNFEEKE